MSNPVFDRSQEFSNSAGPVQVQPFGPSSVPSQSAPPYAGQAGQPYSATAYPNGSVPAADLNAMYAAPTASPVQTGRLTYDDVLVKSAGTFAILLVGAVVGWMLAPSYPAVVFAGAAIGFVLALVNIFKRQVNPVLVVLYAAFEGLFVGGVSVLFEFIWPGIVMQAVIGTLAVFGVTLALFASGKIRASAKMTRIVMIAMLGYLLFSIVNLVLMITGLNTDPWGLRGATIMGIPLGVILGVFVIFLAAYSFVMDFDSIQNGVRNGAPAKFAWKAAFGLLLTLVWLYMEILRLLAILRD